MDELRPCPFCGGEAKLVMVFPSRYCAVYCKGCLAETTYFKTKELAIEAWNRMANDGQ